MPSSPQIHSYDTGTGASIEAFLTEAMPAFGWQWNGSNAWKQTVGANLWQVEFGATTTASLISFVDEVLDTAASDPWTLGPSCYALCERATLCGGAADSIAGVRPAMRGQRRQVINE